MSQWCGAAPTIAYALRYLMCIHHLLTRAAGGDLPIYEPSGLPARKHQQRPAARACHGRQSYIRCRPRTSLSDLLTQGSADWRHCDRPVLNVLAKYEASTGQLLPLHSGGD